MLPPLRKTSVLTIWKFEIAPTSYEGPQRHIPVTAVTSIFGEMPASGVPPDLQFMNHALYFLAGPSRHPIADTRPRTRLLTLRDTAALLDLEHAKWTQDQAASPADLQARIVAHPGLSMGSFCPRSGELLASLFMKPVPDDFARRVDTWHDALRLPVPARSRSLFGISLSSRAPAGVNALLQFFWPRALRAGWRHIYLGSPVPGLSEWLARHPRGHVRDYVQARRQGLPLDPQLRYYHRRGFTRIVAVKPGYFPHERSLDHGVLLRGTVPLSSLGPLWRLLPLTATERITSPLAALL